jgi:ribosome-binding factor A
MPERRSREHHMQRMAEALRDEIGTILEGELADPRIGLANISAVQLAPDGRSARVFVEVTGDENQARETMAGIESAKGFIRHELTERLQLRHTPDLHFLLDQSEQYGARIDQLLKRVHKRER